MTLIRKVAFAAAAVVATCLSSEKALAACNSTVNGYPMSVQQCNRTIQIYGRVIPGHYWMDNDGNWVNVNNPNHYGNLYIDAQLDRDNNPETSGSRRSPISPPYSVIDPTGGCEGGSCINIHD